MKGTELTKQDQFEYLCGDFLRLKFNLKRAPRPHQSGTFPGTEGFCVEGPDGYLYGFQAKFGKDAFTSDTIIDSCNKICDGTQKLFLFTKESYPQPKTEKKKLKLKIKTAKEEKIPRSDFEFWENYRINTLPSEKESIISVDFFCGEEFLEEIRGYSELIDIYFNTKRIKEDFYKKIPRPKEEIMVSDYQVDIDNLKNSFIASDADFFGNDILRAEAYQKEYSIRKLTYSLNGTVLETFENLENAIKEKIFPHLEWEGFFESQPNNSAFNAFLERGCSLIDQAKGLRDQYEVELDVLIENNNGIVVNYGAKGESNLEYIEKGKFKFKEIKK